jgi:hypothetical protein
VEDDSTANSVTDHLFKEHSYYFDSGLVLQDQVHKLVQMIFEKNGKGAKKEETKFKVKSDIKDVGGKKTLIDSVKSKGVNRIKAGIEQARELDTSSGSSKAFKKGALEPLKIDPKKKLEPLDNKLQESDDFDLLGFNDSEGKKEVTKKESNEIQDTYDFDFDFEQPDQKDGSKIPPNDNIKPKEVISKELKPKETKPKEDQKHEVKKSEDKGEDNEEDYIIIDGKRFREIQIEGEEDEFLMDDDGNIYDKEGQYIGTAKDGGEEEEEEEEK